MRERKRKGMVYAARPFVAEHCGTNLLRFYAGEPERFPAECEAAKAELAKREKAGTL